jgi:hypothetical protein
MSYKTTSTIHPFIHVFLNTSLTTTQNYGVPADATSGSTYPATVTTGNINIGFPFDSVDSSGGNMLYDNTTKAITIPISGLYIVNYGYATENNSNDTSIDNQLYGVTHSRGTTYKFYLQLCNTERFQLDMKNSTCSSFVVNLNASDTIRGTIKDADDSRVITNGLGATYISIALIAPFSS